MATADATARGRESFQRHAWGDAYAQLSAADRQSALQPDDLVLLATAAALTGKDDEGVDLRTRAHQDFLSRGDIEAAVTCAFWIGMSLMDRGDVAQAGGWFARARRELDESHDCAEQGYLLVPDALQSLFGGDPATAYDIFGRATTIADRFVDRDLKALCCLGKGQSLIALGRPAEGIELLDEAMIAVMAGDVFPIIAGIIYCAVIEACQELFDLRRAKEWTDALARWCASQPGLVPFRGQCLVHRAELMQFHGAWPDAMEEAERARKWLSEPPRQAIGAAHFQLAEIHRLRGEFARAEEAYRQASQWGRSPQPGLARLRLAQGRIDAARAAIQREVDEAKDVAARSKMLPAHVEIMLAASNATAARAAADELGTIAQDFDAPVLRAVAAQANGAVLLAEGRARDALAALRSAWSAWQDLEAPYEAARVRILIGLACREVGDDDTAGMEFDAGRRTFEQLGAAPDLDRVDALAGRAARKTAGGLTAREVEVLALVAAGMTNRAISEKLVISGKTVARHVSNIFTKLGLASRSAATAYAYEHHLV